MRIILHILLKDLRRHWREIVLFFAVTAGWAYQQAHPYTLLWLRQKELLPILLFLLWFFITIRVVQGEALVGDREFWPTRPYRWGQLMAVKALLLVLCLNGALAVAQIYLLAKAGIPVNAQLIPGLLYLQLEFALFLTFPAAVLAAVTESIVQWVLAVIGLGLFIMVVAWLPWSKLPVTLSGCEGTSTVLGFLIIVPALAVTLLLQYARRRVWLARLVLILAVLFVPVVIAVSSSSWMRSIAYPRYFGEAPIHQAFNNGADVTRAYDLTDGVISFVLSDATIRIPITISSNSSDTYIQVEGKRVILDGDNGWHWESAWSRESYSLKGHDNSFNLDFQMPAHLAREMAAKHPTAKVEWALSVYQLGAPLRIVNSSGRLNLPGGGVCPSRVPREGTYNGRGIMCAVPFSLPELMVTRIESGEVTCPSQAGQPPLPVGHHRTSVDWGSGMGAPDFDPNPVHSLYWEMSGWTPAIPDDESPQTSREAFFCPGTPITVRSGTHDKNMTVTVDLGSLGPLSPQNADIVMGDR
jgi:hypothetical protein